jgi:hypothetical protein
MESHVPYYPDIEFESFYQELVRKYEFLDDKISLEEEPQFFSYQRNIARFLSAKTIYESLLIIHEMGTGKTGSGIATIHLVREQDPRFKRVIVLANGKTQLNNFKTEIFLRLPYLKNKYKDTKDENTILRREGYIFETYRVFSKNIEKRSKEELRKIYEFSIIIMDEIHNLTSSTSVSDGDGLTNSRAYKILYEFVHTTLKRRKLLCLTGTPIRDKPQEIAKILNMVIPIKNKLPTGEEFKNEYLETVKEIPVMGDVSLTLYKLKTNKEQEFQRRIQGYVSYLKRETPDNISIIYEKNPLFDKPLLDHFSLYAIIMNEPQNEIYLKSFVEDLESGKVEEEEETKKSSFAYIRSRNTSLMSFPSDEPYIIPQYEISMKDATKKGKYLRNIGWSKAMRKLFPKDLTFEEKLNRVSGYSAIYAEIIKKIIVSPSELVYIYSFLKAGSGIYTLVSFLTEYFQFEIVRKLKDVQTKAKDRRRVLILNHDFLSDNDLRDMIAFFNRKENAMGDYIQVVIGTKQTKEGISLKNIRQIHVVQPDWNYADISQAIFRGFRVRSHEDLLEIIGNVIVKVYQYITVPLVDGEPEVEYSIDYEQYRRSEIKDMNIKMIERQLIISAWDCILNKERNKGMIEGSRECEYQKCDYVCRGSEIKKMAVSYDTNNMYYSDMQKNVLKMRIKSLLESKDFLDKSELGGENPELVEQVLNDLLLDTDILYNRRGDRVFLRKQDDNFFTVLDKNQHDLLDSYYNTDIVFNLIDESRFEKMNENFYEYRFPLILRHIMNVFYKFGSTHVYTQTILFQSPIALQELLIETILLIKKTNAFFKFVVEHYMNQGRLVFTENKYTSTLLPDKIRELNVKEIPLEWKTVEVETMAVVNEEETPEFINKYIIENPYKFYGILEISSDKTVFKIRDVSDTDVIFGTNKSKKSSGETCSNSFSRKKEGLIKILLRLDWKPETEPTESIETIKKSLKPKLIKDLGIDVKNEELLKTIFVLQNQKIPVLCGYTRERFRELDLLYSKQV